MTTTVAPSSAMAMVKRAWSGADLEHSVARADELGEHAPVDLGADRASGRVGEAIPLAVGQLVEVPADLRSGPVVHGPVSPPGLPISFGLPSERAGSK
ncbi:MAG: hypothetical protein ACRDV6_06705 [Acidimicrobiales bacterium]